MSSKMTVQTNESVDTDTEISVDVNPVEHARLLRKLDWNLLPLVSFLYLLAFLDRVNIGNAGVLGMVTDLQLTGLRYNTAAAVFFIPYSLAEVPSNIILKLFRPSRWIPIIMLIWGLIMTLMSRVTSYQGLVVARIFLGFAEAGLFPGINYYISLWYPRADRARRVAIFLTSATTAGACGGLLAYAIQKMDGIGGLYGWQWIFCLEGLATMAAACMAFFLMHDYPDTASFLTETERNNIVQIMKNDSQNLATHFEFEFILQAVTDYKTYVQVGIFIGVLIPVYAISIFLPTIISDLGYSDASAELLSVPPFLTAFVTTVLVGVYSDIFNTRGPFVIASAFLSLLGYIVLYTQTNAGMLYVGAILATAGVFPAVVIVLVWAGSNAGGDIKRGVVLAMVIGMGNLGGICSSYIYFDPPYFHIGHGTMIGCLGLTMILSVVAMWDCDRINKRKVNACRLYKITEEHKDRFRNMGDESPLFRYTL